MATFLAFTIIFFIVLTMGMSGINKELEGLKIRVSYGMIIKNLNAFMGI